MSNAYENGAIVARDSRGQPLSLGDECRALFPKKKQNLGRIAIVEDITPGAQPIAHVNFGWRGGRARILAALVVRQP